MRRGAGSFTHEGRTRAVVERWTSRDAAASRRRVLNIFILIFTPLSLRESMLHKQFHLLSSLRGSALPTYDFIKSRMGIIIYVRGRRLGKRKQFHYRHPYFDESPFYVRFHYTSKGNIAYVKGSDYEKKKKICYRRDSRHNLRRFSPGGITRKGIQVWKKKENVKM